MGFRVWGLGSRATLNPKPTNPELPLESLAVLVIRGGGGLNGVSLWFLGSGVQKCVFFGPVGRVGL